MKHLHCLLLILVLFSCSPQMRINPSHLHLTQKGQPALTIETRNRYLLDEHQFSIYTRTSKNTGFTKTYKVVERGFKRAGAHLLWILEDGSTITYDIWEARLWRDYQGIRTEYIDYCIRGEWQFIKHRSYLFKAPDEH